VHKKAKEALDRTREVRERTLSFARKKQKRKPSARGSTVAKAKTSDRAGNASARHL